MATTYNIVTGNQGISEARDYYGPYLSQLRGDPDNPVWGGGAQRVPYETGSQAWGWAKFAAGTGALFASGFVPISWKGKQYRLWDAYVEGLRYLEEYSPGRVLRTFQASSLLSPLEARSRATRIISPETMMAMAQGPESAAWHGQLEFWSKQARRPFTTPDILERGLRFEGGKLMVEGTGEVLLQHAAVIRNVAGSSNLLEAAARNVEAKVVPNMFSLKIPFGPGEAAETFSFVGGQTRAELAGRIGGAYATELMERVNRLFRAPAEMEPLRSLWEKGPGKFVQLGVKPGKHYEVFGRMLLKYGWGLPAGIAAYKYLDYQVRDAGLLNWSIFDEGITAGLATMWTKANLAYHHVADTLGWQSYGRWQEEAAPGSTSLSRLLGFPITTGIAGLAALGIHRGIVTAGLQKGGMPLGEASTEAMKRVAAFEGDNWFAKLGKKLASRPPMKFLGKITPGKLAFGIGAAIGLAPILPFLPGALAPEYTAEDLQAFYGGRKEVPVRAGRGWELGRSSYEGGRIVYHRPHWYRRLLDRSKDKAVWGPIEEEEGVEELSPFRKWWIANMTYDLERVHYYDRPYPISAPFGTDIPLIGPAVAGTIGKVIKPPLIMHSQDWLRSPDPDSRELSRGDIANWNEQQALHMPTGYGERRALELGEQAPGMPISPYGIKGTVGEQAYRFCFLGNTNIRMADQSYRSIAEVEIGDYVWSHNGPKRVTNKFIHKQMKEEQLLEVRVGGVFKPLKVTSNHEVLALRTNYCSMRGTRCSFALKKGNHYQRCQQRTCDIIRPEWLPIGELKQGDFLIEILPSLIGRRDINLLSYLAPGVYTDVDGKLQRRVEKTVTRTRHYSNKEVVRCVTSTFNSYQITRSEIPICLALTQELGWLFGYFLAEGYVDTWRTTFGAHISERDTYVQRAIDILEKIFSINKYHIDRKMKGEVLTNGIELVVSSVVLAAVFSRLLLDGNNNKLLHPDLICSNEEFLMGVLAGFIDGDGHQREQEISMNQANRATLKQLQDICLSFGVCPGASFQKKASREDGLFHDSYSLTLHKSNIHTLLDKGLDSLKAKQWSSGHLEEKTSTPRIPVRALVGRGHVFKPIRSIKLLDFQAEDLYDLSVEEDHFYTAEDCIVHNSEWIGLPGFIATAIKEKVTGTPDWFDQEMQLESAAKMTSMERAWWDQELGGMAGLSEGLRRLYPHRRRQVQEYNPIPNQMPSWMPGPGDRSVDFSTGDPYTRVPLGESRLPGRGYAVRYPELEGVMPEDYPLLHRLKILGDTAPFSTKYEEHLIQARTARNQGLFSDYEEDMYQMVMEQAKAKKQRREFHEYKYRDRGLPIATRALMKAGGEERPGFIQRMFGSYWEELSHKAETPFEYLTPVAPAHKLIHMRSALEDYAAMQVYGGESSFWQHPWRHFLRPFIDTSKAAVGMDAIPAHVQQRRGIEEYFDILKYIKSTRLQEIAGEVGDKGAYEEFGRLREETLVGVNPYSFNYEAMFRALPRRDRDYFNSFVKADLEDRQKILDLIPDNEKRLYGALWDIKDTQDRSKAIKKDLLSSGQEEKARDAIAATYTRSNTEGFPTSRELWAEYLATRIPGESYVDWYRRTRLIEKRLAGEALPPADWVGWNPSTDLEDIKLKVVEHLGLDYHDFNLWPSRGSQLPYKPFIDKEAVDAIVEGDQSLSQSEIRRRIQELLTGTGMRDIEVTMMPAPRGRDYDEIDLRVDEDRTYDLVHTLQREGMVK